MFAKHTRFLSQSLARSSARNFTNFTPAKLDHTFIPCKSGAGKDAPNLITLHGVLGSGMNFNQIAHKAPISTKVNSYLLDLRNHGKSEHKDSMSYPEMANDVKNFIFENNLQDRENIVLGFSMGARVAMEVSVNYPELVKGVALIDLAPHDYTSDRRFNFVESMNTMLKNLCQIDLTRDRSLIRKDIMSVAFTQDAGEVVNANVIPSEKGGYKWRLNIHSIYNNFLSQILNARYNGYDTYDGPVKLILGAQSEYTSKELVPSFHQIYDNFDEDRDVEVVDNAGHWVHYQQPQEFIKIVSKFLDEVLTTRGN
jgi:pimeloyl-ACP methyl ester carboxylesterase